MAAEPSWPWIRWVEDQEAEGETRELLEQIRARREDGRVPPILRIWAHRPDTLRIALDMSAVHFRSGFLDARIHEMLATYVSAVNRCHY